MISVFEIYKIGIGPSSSHTMGPMKAMNQFIELLESSQVAKIQVHLYGSLALTGIGHATDKAIMLGLMGFTPRNLDLQIAERQVNAVYRDTKLKLKMHNWIDFAPQEDIVFHKDQELQFHPNGLEVMAFDVSNRLIQKKQYFSIGGGFVVDPHEEQVTAQNENLEFPNSFNSAAELLQLCKNKGKAISSLVLENELVQKSQKEIANDLDEIWQAMDNCILQGLKQEGILPGGLSVKRRAPAFHQRLIASNKQDDLHIMDWVNCYAMAVNEENAAGGRVVTAPTNGAAGIVPAVLKYYVEFAACHQPQEILQSNIRKFLLTSSALGSIIKQNASVSGAEVGCQGEVGSACAMAAAGLAEILGGSPEQVENAAEIAIEHNLGLTCDPIHGLVQIPCIERNAVGAVKAINAARLAMYNDGKHFVSFDKAVEVMYQTGKDMLDKYKETGNGGLSVNYVAC